MYPRQSYTCKRLESLCERVRGQRNDAGCKYHAPSVVYLEIMLTSNDTTASDEIEARPSVLSLCRSVYAAVCGRFLIISSLRISTILAFAPSFAFERELRAHTKICLPATIGFFQAVHHSRSNDSRQQAAMPRYCKTGATGGR